MFVMSALGGGVALGNLCAAERSQLVADLGA